MRYGFVIDQDRCIGCHACTVACKEEHNVPVGVFRTWVKYIEKGSFPNVTRHFAVLRCNHCEDAPCVEICPTAALFKRDNGIVDFDSSRCIGCKSCMQACPYDALYIDPNSNTAAKCNYCAHRVENGLEPACVVVCPTQAIVAGDLDQPSSRISRLVTREKVTSRKPHKGTQPKLYYVGVEGDLLQPGSAARPNYMFAQRRVDENLDDDLARAVGHTREVYNVPHPPPWGRLAAWYLWTKSIGAGLLIVAALVAALSGAGAIPDVLAPLIGLGFIGITALILVLDLKRPDRFYYLLLKSNFSSWLVWGAYILMAASLLALIWLGFGLGLLGGGTPPALRWVAAALGAATACYTAFLFAQAKGRDLWQSPLFLWHLLVQAIVAGSAVMTIIAVVSGGGTVLVGGLCLTLAGAVLLSFLMVMGELFATPASREVDAAVRLLTRGRLAPWFWIGAVGGMLVPAALMFAGLATGPQTLVLLGVIASIIALVGLWIFENLWITAGQAVPLS